MKFSKEDKLRQKQNNTHDFNVMELLFVLHFTKSVLQSKNISKKNYDSQFIISHFFQSTVQLAGDK